LETPLCAEQAKMSVFLMTKLCKKDFGIAGAGYCDRIMDYKNLTWILKLSDDSTLHITMPIFVFPP
jgi:hypothetical protein